MPDRLKEPYFSDSIFWVEVDRIFPNPYQPRRTFDEMALTSLAESIRQYGVLQPLVVTRREIERPGEGIVVEYELISGERRLRASKLAGVSQVPVVIRNAEETDRMKLELAIIENLQREDLSPLDRAKAFKRLSEEFSLKNVDIGKRVGKSREYVANTLRMLALPTYIQEALERKEITEGHTRPLLMLSDKPQEQETLFKDIVNRKLNVRDTESLARRAAMEKVRHTALLSPELLSLEKRLSERLGTRVRIEKRDAGTGKVMIDFFSSEDLDALVLALASQKDGGEKVKEAEAEAPPTPESSDALDERAASLEAPPPAEAEAESDDLYSVRNFSV